MGRDCDEVVVKGCVWRRVVEVELLASWPRG